jgi:hypothetical protein
MRGIKIRNTGSRGQLRLQLVAPKTGGGARKGAGRKPRGRPCMPHVTRPKIDPRYPVQVTIRARPGLPSLRSPRLFGALQRAIARASVDRFRISLLDPARGSGPHFSGWRHASAPPAAEAATAQPTT